MPVSELLPHVKEWYNGFSFDGINKLYNPFSILKLFIGFEFRNYWFSTGTSTFFKRYYEPYLGGKKRILLLGLGFLDSELY